MASAGHGSTQAAYDGVSMMDLLPAKAPNASHYGNDTIDVMCMGCFGHFNTIACIRNGIMTVVVLVTAALCVAKICKLHISRHPTLHQYVIFYCATAECLLCAVHWVLGEFVQLDLAVQYLKLIQFLVVSHLYWTLATRALRKEKLTNRVLVPIYSVSLVYFTVMVTLGCVHMKPSWVECFEPYWMGLSLAEFLLVQLFMLAGIYISRRLNEISTLDSVRRAQKRDLWILIFAFEVSSFCGLTYDVTLKILGDEIVGCSGIFLHMQQIYSPVFGTFMLVKLMVPMWAMLHVFNPVEVNPDQDDLLPQASHDGTYTSVFTPPFDRHRYRPLSHSINGDLQASDTETLTPSPVSDVSTPVFGPLRRTTSNLTTIREENHDAHGVDRGYPDDVTDRTPILT